MLRLSRGTVISTDPLLIGVGEQERRAWADLNLVGEVRAGDEVVVNTVSADLGLGSGGFDVVHVNLTRGLDSQEDPADHVLKLNYTSLQHPVEPVEAPLEEGDWQPSSRPPVLVCSLHGQLAPAAWGAAEAGGGERIGYVQTPGGALPGGLSRDVSELRDRGLICGHITAGPCYGGEFEAVSVTGALHAAAAELGWEAMIAAPGPGILGSATRYGHGGMAALDTAHAGLALGLPVTIAPRLSSADPRPRHRGVSHHTEAVLRLLLGSVTVAAPEGGGAVAELERICGGRHSIAAEPVEVDRYGESGLPAQTMGRGIEQDPDFFAAAIAAGRVLADSAQKGAS